MAMNLSSLHWTITGALGDDLELLEELRAALVVDARRGQDLLQRSRCDANWTLSAVRLKSLAASFGAKRLMDAASDALILAPGDPVALRAVDAAICELELPFPA
jgi:hypothetical protein